MLLQRPIKNGVFKLLTNGDDPPADGKSFYLRVPEGVSPPWIRYSILNQNDDGGFKSDTPIYSDISMQVTVISSKGVSSEAENIMEAVFERLDGATFEEEGWKGKIKRVPGTNSPEWDPEEKYWVLISEFGIKPTS